ncbi:hypothetical protein SDC9_93622 [bioreactor metagenome]|uniref:Uncharacterized protein n=1 Tax=bioreactor metagenome TaxID=1076179 RepID=A0A645A144_9ZZZZ
MENVVNLQHFSHEHTDHIDDRCFFEFVATGRTFQGLVLLRHVDHPVVATHDARLETWIDSILLACCRGRW